MFVCVCVCAYTGKYYSVDQVLGYIAQVAYCGLLLRSYLGEADVVGDLNILDVWHSAIQPALFVPLSLCQDTRAFRRSFRTAFVVAPPLDRQRLTLIAPNMLTWSHMSPQPYQIRSSINKGHLLILLPLPQCLQLFQSNEKFVPELEAPRLVAPAMRQP